MTRVLSLPVLNPPARLRRLPQLMLFAGFIAWYFGSRALAESAANGLAFRFRLVSGKILLEACFHLFLLVIGFAMLELITLRRNPLRVLMALPKRPTIGGEWLTGVALGWGIVVAGILPLVLLGRVHARISLGLPEIQAAVLALAVLLVTSLAHEITFRGYPFKCLIGAVGESPAVVLMVLGAGVSAWHNAWVPGIAIIASMLLTLLLSISWLRTRAVWLAWGLHFSSVACGSVLFGLPFGNSAGFTSIVRSTLYGPDWLTGGDFGPAGAFFTLFVLVLSVVVLYRVTREYAWNYTHTPIVAGGYEVSVAQPKAHIMMEEQAAKRPELVQILGTTSTSFSAQSPSAPSLPNRLP